MIFNIYRDFKMRQFIAYLVLCSLFLYAQTIHAHPHKGEIKQRSTTMDVCSAILAINPSAQVSVNAEDLDQITWHGETEVISKSDIQDKQAELKADYDAKEYQRKRKPEYKSWEEQMDLMYHSMNDWKAHVKAVKDKYPKPQE
jgi:hypothetical protein